MVRRLCNLIIAAQPVLVAVLCGVLMVCAVPVTQVFQVLVSEEDVEPLEEDESPLEDPFDAGTIPQRLSLREDRCGRSDLLLKQQTGPNSAGLPGFARTMTALNAGQLAGRNGCGANLRC